MMPSPPRIGANGGTLGRYPIPKAWHLLRRDSLDRQAGGKPDSRPNGISQPTRHPIDLARTAIPARAEDIRDNSDSFRRALAGHDASLFDDR
jgi:hypothetical protein